MKFTCSVIINVPFRQVADLWKDPNNLIEWQEGFKEIKHLEGEPGKKGSVSQIRYQTGKKEMILTETILQNDLPYSFSGQYEHKHMVNTMVSKFCAIDSQSTRYEAEIEYTEFRAFVPKLLAMLLPGMFKRQVQKWLDTFKIFAEREAHKDV